MFNYNLTQWILLFYIYCFLGWCVESTIVSVRERRFINRGFLNGPFLPIYGTGAILILFVSLPLIDNPILVYLAGLVSTTILEYFTGWFMESLFKIKYWDYTEDKFNYKGRICLVSSLFWGVLTLLVVYIIHVPISNIIVHIDHNITVVLSILSSILFLIDLGYSTYNVLTLNKFLSFITSIKDEMNSLSIQIKEKASSISPPELKTLKERSKDLKAQYDKLTSKLKHSHIQLIISYPSATSKKFNDAFKILKSKIENTFSKRK